MNSEECIDSIEELINAICNAPKEHFPSILQSMDIKKEDWYNYAHFDEECYQRHCFFQNDDFELLLLCWEDGQETPIHSHGGQDCWVTVLDGVIEECRYRVKEGTEEMTLISQENNGPGAMSYMNDSLGLHTLGAPFGRSLSLHLYAKPINECKVYNNDATDYDVVEMEVHTEGL